MVETVAETQQHVDACAVDVASLAKVDDQGRSVGAERVGKLLMGDRGVRGVDVGLDAHDRNSVDPFEAQRAHAWCESRLASVTMVPASSLSTVTLSSSERMIPNPLPPRCWRVVRHRPPSRTVTVTSLPSRSQLTVKLASRAP